MKKSFAQKVGDVCHRLNFKREGVIARHPSLAGLLVAIEIGATMVEAQFMKPIHSKEEALHRATCPGDG